MRRVSNISSDYLNTKKSYFFTERSIEAFCLLRYFYSIFKATQDELEERYVEKFFDLCFAMAAMGLGFSSYFLRG